MVKKIAITSVCALILGVSTGCAQVNPNTEGQLQSALEAKQSEFKQCYEAALQRDREIQGNVALKLQIDKTNGKVTQAEVEKTRIADEDMKRCVANAARTIELPEPPGVPVTGHYAVDFSFE